MTDLGMGGTQAKSLQNTKVNENTNVDRREALKNREAMAGNSQVAGLLRKEQVKKTSDRYRAFKSAYQYLLGEEPENEISEELESAPLEEENEIKKDVKVRPNLAEIEEYKIRERFKAKMGLALGDDFDENAPLDTEDNFSSNDRLDDNESRFEVAKYAYDSLIQYIYDSLGSFDFDRLEDSKLLLKYGMPEDAIIKFIMLQQLARAGNDFANNIDMSIMMYKLKKLDISLSLEQIQEILSNDYGTTKRLKYTISGFIYIPILEVMAKIEQDLKDDYQIQFVQTLRELNVPEFDDLKNKFPENTMFSIRDLVINNNNCLAENKKNRTIMSQGLTQTNIKNKEALIDKLKIIDQDIWNNNKEIKFLWLKIAKIVFIYSFINSKLSISDFNKLYPINVMNQTLSLLKIDINKIYLKDFFMQKVNVNSLRPKIKGLKDEPKKNTDMIESKIKNSIMAITKQPLPKQQMMLKNIRTNNYELSSNFYWLKQKRLNEIIDITEELNLLSEEQ